MELREPSDSVLVERTLRGEPQAFESLVERYLRLAGAVAYGVMGDYDRASDVVQDAFLKLHRSLEGLRHPGRFKGWFLRLVKTTAIDHRRRQGRQPSVNLSQLEGIEDELEAAGNSPIGRLVGAERRARVREAVNQLPEQYREVVVLKYLDGLSYEEIAEQTGLSPAAVESKLFRARGRLRQQLEGLFDEGER